MAFTIDCDALPVVDKGFVILDYLLPRNVEINVAGGKRLDAGNVASVKYQKDKSSGTFSLVGLDDPAKPNVSGLKFTYVPKTGVFKGSFSMYATNEGSVSGGKSPKLKKYKVTINGFFVDGGNGLVGVGEATMKKPAVMWPVAIR